MKEKINYHEEWKTLPDEDLKKIFRKLEKQQKMLAGIPVWILLPALVICGFNGYLAGFAATHTGVQIGFSLFGFVDYICFACCGGLMASKNEKNFIAVPIIMLLEMIIMDGLTENVNVSQIVMIIYLAFACFYLKNIVHQLNFLRSLPSFPFDSRQKEIQFEGMTRKQMLEYLERENGGGVKTVGYEEIFDSDNPEEIVNPKLKDEDKLQNHSYSNRRNKNYIQNKSRSLDSTKSMSDDGDFLQSRKDYDDFTPQEIERINRKFKIDQ